MWFDELVELVGKIDPLPPENLRVAVRQLNMRLYELVEILIEGGRPMAKKKASKPKKMPKKPMKPY